MPELPDVVVYLERLRALLGGRRLERVRLKSPFLVRTYDPPITDLQGRTLRDLSRLGKRLVFAFDDDLFLVLHLMIAGRLRYKEAGAQIPGKLGLAAFDFEAATLLLTEAGTKKRASIHVVRGADALADFDRGGLEPLEITSTAFAERLRSENRTLKRALTDPRLFSGIGNAYSDEILHHARLSPVQLTSRLSDDEVLRLHASCGVVLTDWVERLRAESGDGFPEKVTAFREEMAVHGRYREPCPDCGTKVQRIAYAANECNYCPACQTGGRLLADRGLSRLLKSDWPKTLEELEERLGRGDAGDTTARDTPSRTVPSKRAPSKRRGRARRPKA